MGIIDLLRATIELILRVWGWVSGRSKQQLLSSRRELEEKNREAQLSGDLDVLQKTRAEIEEIDRRLNAADY